MVVTVRRQTVLGAESVIEAKGLISFCQEFGKIARHFGSSVGYELAPNALL